jgi:hypothetical protein
MGNSLPVAQVLSFLAIAVMVYCLWLVVRLKASIPGGVVGKRWNVLTTLVVLFTVGYLTTPFFGAIPEDALRLIVGAIFLFGAVYVVLTVKLIHRIIRELTE